jgi:hypothetical protein
VIVTIENSVVASGTGIANVNGTIVAIITIDVGIVTTGCCGTRIDRAFVIVVAVHRSVDTTS